ncbi:copper resistance protein B [Pyruvatibacter mobilis]|uniref:copper resistance protein B n=1 Tax=Pyruvatibacter mobilis TaxID=1712261 RepID=UPI003BA907B3
MTKAFLIAMLMCAALFLALFLGAAVAMAEPLVWGIQAEQAEYRVSDDEKIAAWDFDAQIGSDELKFVLRSEAEFDIDKDTFETLENQARLQMPVSDFFDAVAGIRVDTPDGPDRVYGVLGLHGLTKQWFEIDADFFISDNPTFRFEAEYEGLITNRIIFTPSIEIDVPFTDDDELEVGAWGPKLEVGGRLSYDLIDRAISPYVGVHYERVFGETADIARANAEDTGAVFFVVGTRVMY